MLDTPPCRGTVKRDFGIFEALLAHERLPVEKETGYVRQTALFIQ